MKPATRWLPLAVAALAVAVSVGRFDNDWVFDDDDVIRDGALIHDPARLLDAWTSHTLVASRYDPGLQPVDTYRPMPLTSFTLDAMISGRDPWAFHVTAALLHVGCALLVFAIGAFWLKSRWAAFYGAAVFAAHPWGVEAHVWLNGRSDPLALLFGLAALRALLEAERRRDRWRWRAGAAACLTLGLFSKETLLLVLPALALMPGPPERDEPWTTRSRGRLLPLVLPAAIYLTARTWVLGGARAHRDADMLLDAAWNLPWLLLDGLRQAAAPATPHLRSLRDDYAGLEAVHITLACLALLVIATLAWRARRRFPVAAWSTLWFFAPLVPVAIISTVLWPGFGRYLYIPLAGLAWALAELGGELRARPAIRAALGALHVLLLAALAWSFTDSFQDTERLYADAIAANPESAMAHGFLGITRYEERDLEAAIPPLARAVALDPDEHRYRIHLARALNATGRQEDATALARESIALFRGRREEAPYHLVVVNALREPDRELALRHLDRCLEVWPGRPDCQRARRFLLEGEAPAPR